MPKYLPPIFQGAMQNMGLGADMGDSMVAAPMPPIPEQVASYDYLRSLAEHRRDDLVNAGSAGMAEPARLIAEAADAARQYAELYAAAAGTLRAPPPAAQPSEPSRFAELSEQERLMELSQLVGRLRDSLGGPADLDIERQLQELADTLPPKYRARDLIAAARIPGERGQRLAELYIERCFKLYNEEYLDLERIDREIEAIEA
jgi:hypothetical protein